MSTVQFVPCPSEFASHAPDAHLVLPDKEDKFAARCSLWWKAAPQLPGERIGVIGHYAAGDQVAGQWLLQNAAERLAAEGCTLAIGPMEGNTWRRYRFVTERGSEPPFLMEPDNPPEWPDHWRAAGFNPLAQYFSALGTDLARGDTQVRRAGDRLRASGVALRALRGEDFENELRRIHEMSVEAFADNFLYTPLPEAEFLAQYAAMQQRVRADLVLLAEISGRLAGYVFTIPDWLRGPATDTLIVKTLAVRPGRQSAGLGAWLLQEVQQRAQALGFRRVIHALMHESNHSLNLSRRYAEPFRRYTIYSRRLTSIRHPAPQFPDASNVDRAMQPL
jgi:GNAT superfamily N-acetyltransferase